MIFAFVLAMVAQAVPPPMPQSTADCSRPVYASDLLVCADPVLGAIDRDLRTRVLSRPAPVGRWIEDPESWFRRSRLCAMKAEHRICLLQAYRERIALMTFDPKVGTPKPCGRMSIVKAPDDARGLLGDDGALLALGRRVSPEWTPFVSVAAAGGRIIFRDAAGRVLARCPTEDAW